MPKQGPASDLFGATSPGGRRAFHGPEMPQRAEGDVPRLPGRPEEAADGERRLDHRVLREQGPDLAVRGGAEAGGERTGFGDRGRVEGLEGGRERDGGRG